MNFSDQPVIALINSYFFWNILEIHKYVLLDRSEDAGKLRKTNVYLMGVPFVPQKHEYVEEEMRKVI